MFKATHTGQLHGDARTGDKRPTVKLRATARFYITEHGTKYRKDTGWPTGDDHYPLWTLDVSTIKPI